MVNKVNQTPEQFSFPSYFEYQKERLFIVAKTLIFIATFYIVIFAFVDFFFYPDYRQLVIIGRSLIVVLFLSILGVYHLWGKEKNFSLSVASLTFLAFSGLVFYHAIIPEKNILIMFIFVYFQISTLSLSPLIKKVHLLLGLLMTLVVFLFATIYISQIQNVMNYFWIHLTCTTLLTMLMSFKLINTAKEHYQIAKKAHDKFFYDYLTGVLNRQGIFAWLQENKELEFDNTKALLMIDLDNFKNINDNYGHDVGDEVIYQAAQTIKNTLGNHSEVGRMGGEEYLAVVFAENMDQVEIMAQKVVDNIFGMRFGAQHLEGFNVTASIGVAECEADGDINNCIKKADQLMYHAKRSGKNKITTSESMKQELLESEKSQQSKGSQ